MVAVPYKANETEHLSLCSLHIYSDFTLLIGKPQQKSKKVLFGMFPLGSQTVSVTWQSSLSRKARESEDTSDHG